MHYYRISYLHIKGTYISDYLTLLKPFSSLIAHSLQQIKRIVRLWTGLIMQTGGSKQHTVSILYTGHHF